MYAAADEMDFERAATIRDRIEQMRGQIGRPVGEADSQSASRKARRAKKRKTGDPAQWKGRAPRPKRDV